MRRRLVSLLVVLLAGVVVLAQQNPITVTSPGSGYVSSSGVAQGQITWPAGLGAITHILGPSDQNLIVSSGAARSLVFAVNSATKWTIGTSGGLFAGAVTGGDAGANTINLSHVYLAGSLFATTIAPTRNSGFGTNADASFATGSTDSVFDMNIGTGGAPTSGVLNMTAAAHGWICQVRDITTPADNTYQSAYTTNTVTFTTTIAWTAGDHLYATCSGF